MAERNTRTAKAVIPSSPLNLRPRYISELITLVLKAKSFGYLRFENGVSSYGERSNFLPGEEKWLHTLYPGLRRDILSNIDVDYGLRFLDGPRAVSPVREAIEYCGPLSPIFPDYKVFLRNMNGARLFGGHLIFYGVRMSADRLPLERPEPLELLDANVYQRPEGLDERFLVVGGYRADGSLICMDESGACHRIGRDDGLQVLNSWRSFADLVGSECRRLEPCFDAEGNLVSDRALDLPTGEHCE